MLNALIHYLNGAIAATGAHSITQSKVMAPTSPDAINPTNPGAFDSIRTAAVCPSPRYFNKAEADKLTQLAKAVTTGARESDRAYKALLQIEQADATVHVGYRQYQAGLAEAELTKKRADYSLAKKLHGQRVAYAQMGHGLISDAYRADQAIAKIRQRLEGAQ